MCCSIELIEVRRDRFVQRLIEHGAQADSPGSGGSPREEMGTDPEVSPRIMMVFPVGPENYWVDE